MNYCRYHCQILSVAQWFHTLHRSTWSGRGGRLLGVSEDDVFFCAIGQWLLHHLRAIYWIVFNLLIYRYNIYIYIYYYCYVIYSSMMPWSKFKYSIYSHFIAPAGNCPDVFAMHSICGIKTEASVYSGPLKSCFFSPYYFNQRFFTHFVNLA